MEMIKLHNLIETIKKYQKPGEPDITDLDIYNLDLRALTV